ncbi:hypothetical protein BV25DRAFT_1804358 [Artomyces pyxidatus]|uniref:Uncharacterized protein n=1 Tax=Artomyces pyxidatus TaxID=48021 RepID=A0ACB8T0N2_9AGAM|nr:hypothetical protein BV25DRAFT_1804358 [Artomyces pyxidatus]
MSQGTPILRLDTAGIQDDFLDASKTPIEPTSSIRTRARALSQAATLRLSASPLNEKIPPSPSFQPAASAPYGTNRARDESQKLLSHLLDQLRRRPQPPPLFDALTIRSSTVTGKRAGSAKGVVGFASNKKGKTPNGQNDSDSDEEIDTGFSPDVALDLMNRLRDVLTISLAQQWQIFHDGSSTRRSSTRGSKGYDEVNPRLSPSPFRLRRRSRDASSRSPSPSPDDVSQAPELLSQCISILHSIVSEDCRHQLSSPRLLRPPNALQAISLDVAQLLIHMHQNSPAIISQVGFALLPALATFRAEMHFRLLSLFEEGILRGVLSQAREIQGLDGDLDVDQKDGLRVDVNGLLQPLVSIQVEEPQDEDVSQPDFDWRRWMLSFPETSRRIPSSNTPGQSLSLYHLTSLVAPLLAAVLEGIDFTSARLPTLHRFYRLFSMIVDLKPDVYLDVLQVVAYHTARARRAALEILSSYWPRALGHPIISKPLRILTYAEAIATAENAPPARTRPGNHPYAHQFVLWRFLPLSTPSLFQGQSFRDCRSCSNTIDGFGLLCPFCTCSVHFDCYDYPDGNLLAQYAMEADSNVQKLAVHRFCHILPSRRSAEASVAGHNFRSVNLFTLALCFLCRQPLWGSHAQGLKCDHCQHFVHSHCVSPSASSSIPRCRSTPLAAVHVTISWSDLRHSFRSHYQDLISMSQGVGNRSYEEVSVCSDTLSAQLQIFENGLAMGSVVIEGKDIPSHSDGTTAEALKFDLHSIWLTYQSALDPNTLPVSGILDEYFQESHLHPSRHSILYDWATLLFLTSSLKTSHDNLKLPTSDSLDLLAVQPISSDPDESLNNPYEVLSLAHIRDALGIGFQLHSEPAACLVLSHLHHVGLFDRMDMQEHLFDEPSKPESAPCVFPLPLGLDMSVDVETLVAAVEACLSDIDLAVNEAGFLLLLRRFWPNEMATTYALRRLARALISWILAEDEHMAIILRDYVAPGRSLPGVRAGSEVHPWPSSNSRAIHTTTANNGGDYVAHRRNLLKKYAFGWLLALHDQDIAFYAQAVYELVVELCEDSEVGADISAEQATDEKLDARAILIADRTLRHIIRLHQATVIFTAFDDIFMRWLESASSFGIPRKPIASLQRLLNRDGGISQRVSSAVNLTATIIDPTSLTAVDPWTTVLRVATADVDGLRKSLQWLYMFARSGVDIPVSIFQQFASFTGRSRNSLVETIPLVKAILSSLWLKSLGRQELLTTIGSLHLRLSSDVLSSITTGNSLSDVIIFIRSSLACCLLLAGCERQTLSGFGMVTDEEVVDLPSSRRTVNARASMVPDPINLHTGFIDALGSYVNATNEEVSILVAKFIHLLVSQCYLLEPYEVDNFILRNVDMLSLSAWSFYELQNHQLSSIRPSVLLRILVVDPQPFERLLSETLKPSAPWELRLQAMKRLFRIILDVTNPAFNVEERQWRSSIICAFTYYFTAMWKDPQEEIRVTVETWSRTLLPAHMDAISSCWNESIAKAPIADRVKLVAFLIQLQPHFVSWRVLSWEVIVETLLEEDYIQHNAENGDGPASAHLSMYGLSSRDSFAEPATVDEDVVALHVSLILLSLNMIEAGVTIDTFSLLKIKRHLVQVIGFTDVSTIPSATGQTFYIAFEKLGGIPEYVWACIDELLPVLDAAHPFSVSASAMTGSYSTDDTQSSLLIGSPFVDVVLALINEMKDLLSAPFLSTKTLLECLMVIVYKHDMESKPLKHLQGNLRQAVRRMLSITLAPVSYDLRQLALSVIQAYVKRWPNAVGSFVLEYVETLVQLITSLEYNNDDVLASQAASYMEITLSMFAENGLLAALCKRRQGPEFYVVMRSVTDPKARTSSGSQSLRDNLLRDAFSRIADLDAEGLKLVLGNVNSFIEKVHGQGYNPALMQHVGMCLTNVIRHTAEWSLESFDPSPLLLIASTLVENNKAQSRDLFVYLETTLRAVLARFHVSRESLTRVLQVTGDLYRKTKRQDATVAGKLALNNVTSAFLEIYSEGLRRKARIFPSTLAAMTEALLSTVLTGSIEQDLDLQSWISRVSADGMTYLQTHVPQDGNAETEFISSLTIAKLVMYGADQNPDIVHSQLSEPPDKSSRQPVTLRTWNVLLLSALQHQSTSSGVTIMSHFPTFVLAYRDSLTTSQTFHNIASVAANINHCYASIKLWFLLDRRLSTPLEWADTNPRSFPNPNSMALMIWNELWPPFLDLISQHASELQRGQNSPLASTVSSSIADLFLFLREFRSVLTLDTAFQVATLNRLRIAGRPDVPSSKLSRTLRELHEPAPSVPWTTLVDQAKNDVMAAEKLEILELYQKEKLKRDSRVVS